jgi:hypothetical protein
MGLSRKKSKVLRYLHKFSTWLSTRKIFKEFVGRRVEFDIHVARRLARYTQRNIEGVCICDAFGSDSVDPG